MDFKDLDTFIWDRGTETKNVERHGVGKIECEQVFFDTPVFFSDIKHSKIEERYISQGETVGGRRLLIIFTIRNEKIRVISARDQNKKERIKYYKLINTQ